MCPRPACSKLRDQAAQAAAHRPAHAASHATAHAPLGRLALRASAALAQQAHQHGAHAAAAGIGAARTAQKAADDRIEKSHDVFLAWRRGAGSHAAPLPSDGGAAGLRGRPGGTRVRPQARAGGNVAERGPLAMLARPGSRRGGGPRVPSDPHGKPRMSKPTALHPALLTSVVVAAWALRAVSPFGITGERLAGRAPSGTPVPARGTGGGGTRARHDAGDAERGGRPRPAADTPARLVERAQARRRRLPARTG